MIDASETVCDGVCSVRVQSPATCTRTLRERGFGGAWSPSDLDLESMGDNAFGAGAPRPVRRAILGSSLAKDNSIAMQ